MKKIFATCLLLLPALTAIHAQEPLPQGQYTVKGELNDSSAHNQMIYLRRFDDYKALDSARVDGKTLTFRGSIGKPRFCRIDVGRKAYANFILEEGEITLNFKSPNSPKGTPLNELMAQINAHEDSTRQMRKARHETLRAQYTDPQQLADTLKRFSEATKAEMFKECTALFRQHGDDAIGECLLRSSYIHNLGELRYQEPLFGLLGPWLRTTRTAKGLIALLEGKKNTAEGMPYANITGEAPDGTPAALADFIGKGNYVLMDMWASWCGPCKQETPNLALLHRQFKDKGLTVLGLFVWDRPKNLKKAMEEEGITWPQIIDTQKNATDLYGVRGIPHIILFAPDGTILKRDLRGKEMIETVTEIMNGGTK